MRTLMIDLTGPEAREIWVKGAPMCPEGSTSCDGSLTILPREAEDIVWCPTHRIVVAPASEVLS